MASPLVLPFCSPAGTGCTGDWAMCACGTDRCAAYYPGHTRQGRLAAGRVQHLLVKC